MNIVGPIYAFDLGVKSGIARGAPGEHPWSAILTLKKPGESRDVAFSNFIAFLHDEWSAALPVLVVKEAMLPLEAFRKIGNAESTVRLHAGLHAIVEGMCGRFGIPWRDVHDPTVRKHFLGRANMGNRDATKLAVVARCHLLGLMPRDCHDNNRADALATHDWACANFGRRSVSTSELYLFGERSPRECNASTMEGTRVAV